MQIDVKHKHAMAMRHAPIFPVAKFSYWRFGEGAERRERGAERQGAAGRWERGAESGRERPGRRPGGWGGRAEQARRWGSGGGGEWPHFNGAGILSYQTEGVPAEKETEP